MLDIEANKLFTVANSLFDRMLNLFNVIAFESVLFIALRPYSDQDPDKTVNRMDAICITKSTRNATLSIKINEFWQILKS